MGKRNDGDYITTVSTISEKDLAAIKPLIAAIKDFKSYEVEYKGYDGVKNKWTHHHN